MDEGLLPKSFIQIIKNKLSFVYRNVHANSSPQLAWLSIILVIYISSVGFYALLPANPLVFAKDSNMYNVVKFISIIYRALATNIIFDEKEMIFFYIILTLYVLMLILFIAGYVTIKKIGKLPRSFANILEFASIFLSRFLTLGFTGFLGTATYHIISNPTKCGYAPYLVFVFSLLIEYFQLSMLCGVINNQITYQKGRSWGWTSENQTRAIFFIQLFGWTTRIAECSTGTIEYIFLGISILITVLFVIIPYFLPIVISSTLNSIWIASADCAFILMIVILIYHVMNLTVPSNEIFIIYMALIAGSYFFMTFLNRRRKVKGIEKIDQWASTGEELDVLFKSPLSFVYCMRSAFSIGDPNIVNWHIVREALRVWPSSTILWRQSIMFMTAFAADAKIFEETVLLYQTSLGYKDQSSIPFIKLANSVIDARKKETNQKLKFSLQRANRNMSRMNQIIAAFWDGVVSSQLSNSYKLAAKAYDLMNITDAEFKQLMQEFPGNFQLLADYSKFLETSLGDSNESCIIRKKARIIHDSKIIIKDRTEKFMHEMFPMLPDKAQEADGTDKREPIHDDADFLSSSIASNSYIGSILNDNKEESRAEEVTMFDKGLRSKPILVMKVILVFVFVFVFATGTIVPSALMLVHYNKLTMSVGLMASVSFIPVEVSRAEAALFVKAMRREDLILSQAEVEGDFNFANNATLGDVLLDTTRVLAERVMAAAADRTGDAGFDTATQSYLEQTWVDFFEAGKSGSSSHRASLAEALASYQATAFRLSNDNGTDKWISDGSADFGRVVWNGDVVADSLIGFLDVMHDSIKDQAASQASVITTALGVFIALTILASCGCYVASVSIRLNFEHITRVLTSIPKAAFYDADSDDNDDNDNDNDRKGKSGGKDYDSAAEKKIRLMANVRSGEHSGIPTPIVGAVSFSFILILLVMDVMMLTTLRPSNVTITRTPHQMELIVEIETGVSSIAVGLLRICAMSQGKNIGEMDSQETATQLIKHIATIRARITELLLDGEHGISGVAEMNAVFFKGEFNPVHNLHLTYRDTHMIAGLQIMLDDAMRKMEAVKLGNGIQKDDQTMLAFVHELLFHQYTDLFEEFYDAAIGYSTSNIMWKKVLVIIYLVIGLILGMLLLIYATVSITKMQNIINYIIYRLKFLNQQGILTCTPLIRLLSGADGINESTKDLSFIESADNTSETPSFVLSPRRQILWANEAAISMCGSRTIINDMIDGFIKFAKKEVEEALSSFLSDTNLEINTKITVCGQKRKKHCVRVTSVRERGKTPVFVLTIDSLAAIKEKKSAIKRIGKQVEMLQETIVPRALSTLMGRSTGIVIDRATTLCIRLYLNSEQAQASSLDSSSNDTSRLPSSRNNDIIELEESKNKEAPKEASKQSKEEEDEKEVILDTRSSTVDIVLPVDIGERPSILTSVSENNDQNNDQNDDNDEEKKDESQDDALSIIKTLDDISLIIQNCNEKNCVVVKRIGFTFIVITNINGKAADQRESLSYALSFLGRIRQDIADRGALMTASCVFSPHIIVGRPNIDSANFNIYAPEVQDATRMVARMKPGMLLISPQCNPDREKLQFVVGADGKQTNMVPIETLSGPPQVDNQFSGRILDIVNSN